MDQSSNNPTRVIALVIVAIVAVGGIAYALMSKKASAPTQTAQSDSSSTTAEAIATASSPAATQTSTYKDGTYSATGSYQSPGGDEKIGVQLTLQDDVITDVSVTPEPVSAEGVQFQKMFASGYKALVVGKNIADVHLTHVSGSSLTPGGFNDALAQIETQAQA